MIKDKLLSMLSRIIYLLEKLSEKFSATQQNSAYTSLAPVDKADEDKVYGETLKWALENRKQQDIRNIAITGPYGSGKSSILKTFQKRMHGSEFIFLNISLATFKEEKERVLSETDQQEQLRLIELSILQQIFYGEKPNDIPDSRFKRIVNLGKWKIASQSVLLIILGLALAILTNTAIFGKQILSVIEDQGSITDIKLVCFGIVGLGIWYLITISIRTISKIRFKKVTIQDADFEVDDSINKSILNHHIDELLYFFEVTKYNVVIIEDLDRFQQTEIFTKLREINLLINKSKRVNREIVFIYAVKDDMFKENDRTKFFDFIIPVIPVINSANSSQKLLEKRQLNSYNWNEDIMEDLAIFIEDMRLLHNITNEFNLYKLKLSSQLDENKLLAILVYKNLYPGDYSILSEGSGMLYNSLNRKQILVQQFESDLDNKITELIGKIAVLSELMIVNIRELNSIYILRIVIELTGFVEFLVNDVAKTLDEMLNQENFEYILRGEAKYRFNYNYSTSVNQVPKLTPQIETSVDNNRTYKKRKELIDTWNKGNVEALKKEIQEIETKKANLRSTPLSVFLSESTIEHYSENLKQDALLKVLLRNGYIAEDYTDYISLFYEGSLTKADYSFLLNVKSQRQSEFKYTIFKIDQVIKRINLFDFGKPFVLNYMLVDHILINQDYKNHLKVLNGLLSDGSQTSTTFIDGMMVNSKHQQTFINSLCSSWHDIWIFVAQKSNYTADKVEIYFKAILRYANISDIAAIARESDLIQNIISRTDFLSILNDESRTEKIIKALSPKFVRLDEKMVSLSQLHFIHDNNYYELNRGMIEIITQGIGKFDQIKFDTCNFTFIQDSGCKSLITYVDNNINEYLENVYLTIPANTKEPEYNYLKLLNHSNASDEILEQVIKSVQTLITDITNIEYSQIGKLLFETNKVLPTWLNIYQYYLKNNAELADFLISFINEKDNHASLNGTNFRSFDEDQESTEAFVIKLLESDQIVDQAYGTMLTSFQDFNPEFDFVHLSGGKVKSLIANKLIKFNQESLIKIKNIAMELGKFFLEVNKNEYLTNLEEFLPSGVDAIHVLTSSEYTTFEKSDFIEKIDETVVTSSDNVSQTLTRELLKNSTFVLKTPILRSLIINKKISSGDRIRLFNDRFQAVDNLDNFINSLDQPFSSISIRGLKPHLPKTDSNLRFAQILYEKNYISSFKDDEKAIKIYTFKKE